MTPEREQALAEFKANLVSNPPPPMPVNLEHLPPEALVSLAQILQIFICTCVEVDEFAVAKGAATNLAKVEEFVAAKQAACECPACTANRKASTDTKAAIDAAKAGGNTPRVNASGNTLQ